MRTRQLRMLRITWQGSKYGRLDLRGGASTAHCCCCCCWCGVCIKPSQRRLVSVFGLPGKVESDRGSASVVPIIPVVLLECQNSQASVPASVLSLYIWDIRGWLSCPSNVCMNEVGYNDQIAAELTEWNLFWILPHTNLVVHCSQCDLWEVIFIWNRYSENNYLNQLGQYCTLKSETFLTDI